MVAQKTYAPGSMFAQFTTNPELEMNGVEIDYGPFMVTIARAGGANKRFQRVMTAKTKAHRRAIQTETLSEELASVILKEAYAEAVILNWQTKVEGKFKKGIESPTGGPLLPVTFTNIVATLEALPELFRDLQEQASRITLFRDTIMEDDAGN
mgnify:CR=1 FL=1